jgi:four helix bundle protein
MKNYKHLIIWQRGIEIVKKAYDISKKFPKEEKYGLISQITRAAVSIPANIAEGSSRESAKDYARFLQHALGSAFEVQTYLDIAEHLEWLSKQETEEVQILLEEEIKMVHRFIKKLTET